VKVTYFHDTDTALIEFSTREVVETKEISENIYIDVDASGNPVSMTIEHAEQHTDLPNLSYMPIGYAAPNPPLEEHVENHQ
jgi:uncharacterized protein YuzE